MVGTPKRDRGEWLPPGTIKREIIFYMLQNFDSSTKEELLREHLKNKYNICDSYGIKKHLRELKKKKYISKVYDNSREVYWNLLPNDKLMKVIAEEFLLSEDAEELLDSWFFEKGYHEDRFVCDSVRLKTIIDELPPRVRPLLSDIFHFDLDEIFGDTVEVSIETYNEAKKHPILMYALLYPEGFKERIMQFYNYKTKFGDYLEKDWSKREE
jgi:hypothetical protein